MSDLEALESALDDFDIAAQDWAWSGGDLSDGERQLRERKLAETRQAIRDLFKQRIPLAEVREMLLYAVRAMDNNAAGFKKRAALGCTPLRAKAAGGKEELIANAILKEHGYE